MNLIFLYHTWFDKEIEYYNVNEDSCIIYLIFIKILTTY